MSVEPDVPGAEDRAQAQAWPEAEARSLPQPDAIPQSQTVPQSQVVPQSQAVPQVVLPKNPAVGVILSFFIPGLGTMVNGNGARGAVILGVYALGWILSLFLIGIPILIGAWIWGMIDGYLSAQRWNASHGIIS